MLTGYTIVVLHEDGRGWDVDLNAMPDDPEAAERRAKWSIFMMLGQNGDKTTTPDMLSTFVIEQHDGKVKTIDQ